MTTLNFSVSNMSCGNCVKHVTNALTAINGVSKVDVNLNTGHVSIEGNFSEDPTLFISALAEEGYPASVLTS